MHSVHWKGNWIFSLVLVQSNSIALLNVCVLQQHRITALVRVSWIPDGCYAHYVFILSGEKKKKKKLKKSIAWRVLGNIFWYQVSKRILTTIYATQHGRTSPNYLLPYEIYNIVLEIHTSGFHPLKWLAIFLKSANAIKMKSAFLHNENKSISVILK